MKKFLTSDVFQYWLTFYAVVIVIGVLDGQDPLFLACALTYGLAIVAPLFPHRPL